MQPLERLQHLGRVVEDLRAVGAQGGQPVGVDPAVVGAPGVVPGHQPALAGLHHLAPQLDEVVPGEVLGRQGGARAGHQLPVEAQHLLGQHHRDHDELPLPAAAVDVGGDQLALALRPVLVRAQLAVQVEHGAEREELNGRALVQPAVEVRLSPSGDGRLDPLHAQRGAPLAHLQGDPTGVAGGVVVEGRLDPVAEAVARRPLRPVEQVHRRGRRGRRGVAPGPGGAAGGGQRAPGGGAEGQPAPPAHGARVRDRSTSYRHSVLQLSPCGAPRSDCPPPARPPESPLPNPIRRRPSALRP